MAAILALPPPSSLPAANTFGRAKALLASDAAPVTAIRPTAGEDRRQWLRQAAGQTDAAEDESAAAVSGRSRQAAAGAFTGAGAGEKDRPARQAPVDADLRSVTAGASSAFIAQSLYQEGMGSGLHIEPWDQALGAYRRADAAGMRSTRTLAAV